MADILTIAGSDLDPIVLPAYDRVTLRPVAMAYDGQVGSGSVFIRDDFTFTTKSGRRITLKSGGNVVADGFLGQQQQTRPGDDALKRGNGYSWSDTNLLLAHRRIEYWVRPDETDVARVLAAMAAFCPAVSTSPYVTSGITIGLPAKTYQDTTLDEVFADAMDQTAKTWFVDRDWNLHFHGLDEDVGYNATISITDSAPDGVTSFAPGNPTRQGDPSNLANDLKVLGADGVTAVIVQDAPSIAAHNVDGLVFQDTVNYPDSSDVGTMTAYADAVLATRAEDRVTYQVALQNLTDPHVLAAGMRIATTSAVLGITGEMCRISQIAYETVAPGVWTLHLDLSRPVKSPWELRHRRKGKKQNTNTGDTVGTTDGAALTLSLKQADHHTNPWDGTDDFSYFVPGGGVTVGSYCQNWVTQADPNWPCSGLGIFFWIGRYQQVAWYEVDLTGITTDVIGLKFSSTTGAPTFDSSFGPGHDTRAADDHPYSVGWGQPDPLNIDDWTFLTSINPFGAWEIFIPRTMFQDGVNALVIAPAWEAYEGGYCGTELVDNVRGPLIGGEGGSRKYPQYQDTSVACVVVSNQAVAGKTQWVPGDGLIDGHNGTFTLHDWNGVGVPEVKMDGLILNGTEYVWDGGAKTVSVGVAPPTGGTIVFRYYRNA